MAQYRYSLSSRISRGSIGGACAYISRTGCTMDASDYLAREGAHGDKQPPAWTGLFAPQNAPARFRGAENAASAWHEAVKTERQHNGQVAEHFIINLPHELTLQQQAWLAQDHIREFTRDGRLVQAAIHNDGRDPRNVHLHLLVSTRNLGADGFATHKAQAQADRFMHKREYLEGLREHFAKVANRHLERHGHEAGLDHRSYARQGIDRKPGRHLGHREFYRDAQAIDRHNERVRIRNASGEGHRGADNQHPAPQEQAMSEARNQRDEIRDRDEKIAGLRINAQNTQQLRDERWNEMSLFEKAGDRLGLRPDEQFRELGLNQSESELRLKEAVTERLRSMSNEERLDEMRLALAPDGRPLTHDSLAAQMNDDYRQISHQHYQLRQELLRADRDVHGMERQFHSLERAHDQRQDDMNVIQRALHNSGILRDKQLAGIEHDAANLLHDAGNRMAERAQFAAGHERLGEVKEAAFRELRPEVERALGERQQRSREALEHYRARVERERSHEHEMGLER